MYIGYNDTFIEEYGLKNQLQYVQAAVTHDKTLKNLADKYMQSQKYVQAAVTHDISLN